LRQKGRRRAPGALTRRGARLFHLFDLRDSQWALSRLPLHPEPGLRHKRVQEFSDLEPHGHEASRKAARKILNDSSATRLDTPITEVGRTALSVEIRTNASAPNA